MFSDSFKFKSMTFAVFAFVFSFFISLSAYAGEAQIHFSDPSVDAGSVVNVSMKITSDEGTAIGSADIMLSYPTEKLSFISGTDADGGNTGFVRVHGVSNGGGSSETEYNLSFQTVSAGTATVGIESVELYDTLDNVIDVTARGSSLITINSLGSESSDASLSLLEVYPGELSPEFSSDTDSYSLSVGLGVERLTINADPSDSSSLVSISGNDSLEEGENEVTITVTAPDSVTVRSYTIDVSKVEGGPESIIGGGEYLSEVEGVQLSSKGKTITIMTPGDDVEIPAGLREGVIKIDDQKVIGWIVDQDEEPEYCVVYGMNEDGELNFYRYDLGEKSIQRYFSDPLVAGSVSEAEYSELLDERDALSDQSGFRFIIIAVLCACCLVLALLAAYLFSRLSSERERARDTRSKEMKVRRDIRSQTESAFSEGEEEDRGLDDEMISEPDAAAEPLDETHVIRRSERRRRRRRSESRPESESELNVDELSGEGEPLQEQAEEPLQAEEQASLDDGTMQDE